MFERIARNRYVRAVVRYMYLVSSWYMKRRSATKGFLFFILFVLPILLHAYMSAQPFISYVSNMTSVAQQFREETVSYPRVPCTSLFKGRVFIAGPFSYTACYYVNETHALFDTGIYYGVIEFVYREDQGNSYAISFVHEGELDGVRTRYLVLAVVARDESTATTALTEAIRRHGLAEKLCRSFVPSTSFGGRYLPHQFFSSCENTI